jgi:hypothetical protein
MSTDDLIRWLAQSPAEQWPFNRALKLAVVAGVLVAGAIFALAIQPRPDFADALGSPRFAFKFLVTITAAVSAAGLVRCISQPGSPAKIWRWLNLVAPALLGVSVAAELFAVPRSAWAELLIGENSRVCLRLIPTMAAGPLFCLLVALRKGAPRHPAAAGALAGLLASGIAATFYAARCTDDSPLFIATWYPLATLIVVSAGSAIGAKVLRW